MADWFNITDSMVDPDAPLTSELAYAWRDNPIAISEGAVGAPRVMPKSLMTTLLTRVSVGNSEVSVSGLSGFRRIRIYTSHPGTAQNLTLALGSGGVFATSTIISRGSSSSINSSLTEVDIVDGSLFLSYPNLTTTSISLPSGAVDSIRFLNSTSDLARILVMAVGGRDDV